MTSSMPGRSTFTATSRPSFSVAKCTCAIEALATGSASKLAKIVVDRLAEGLLDQRARLRGRERRHAVLQLGELVGEVRRQQVAPRRQHLAELDEDRPEPLQPQAQPLAARRVEPAADGEHAHQRAHPALAEAGQRQLVQPVAQNRDADEDQPADVPHRGLGPAAVIGLAAQARGDAADRAHRLAQRRGDAAAEARQLARRRIADQPGEVVLAGPSAGCRTASSRRWRAARRRPPRCAAARRPACAPAPAPGSRRPPRRAGRATSGTVVAAPLEQAGGGDAQGQRRQRAAAATASRRVAAARVRAACSRRRCAATGSPAMTWLARRMARSITAVGGERLQAVQHSRIVGTASQCPPKVEVWHAAGAGPESADTSNDDHTSHHPPHRRHRLHRLAHLAGAAGGGLARARPRQLLATARPRC